MRETETGGRNEGGREESKERTRGAARKRETPRDEGKTEEDGNDA